MGGTGADLTFSVPGEVRGKGRPRIGMIGGRKNPASGRREGGLARMIPDKQTVDYEARLRNAARLAMEAAGYHESDFDGPLSVILRARFTPAASTPKKRLAEMLLDRLRPTKKPDMDNIVKLLDALQRKRFKRKDGSFDIEPCVFPDDSAVVELTAFKVYAEEPGLDIRITAWEPEAMVEFVEPEPQQLTLT